MNQKSWNIIFFAVAAYLILAMLLLIGWQRNKQQLAAETVDSRLHYLLDQAAVRPIDLNLPTNPEKIELGRMLFFDKELSGNRDISCATCHHPRLASADARSLSVGTGGNGLGKRRALGENREDIPRNAPEIFNRGSAAWRTMFWDGRVAAETYVIDTPADELLPAGLDSALAAQAMFPPTSRDEMRGSTGDVDIHGSLNNVALGGDTDPTKVWDALINRLMGIEGYQMLFRAAYPGETTFGFEHAANAIAAFEIAAFSFDDSPYDRYVAGDVDALDDKEKAGATLFFGKAGCASCHNGELLTDQNFYNIGIPQLGPGKVNEDGYDFGRMLETGRQSDRFAFRTPPLRNIALTAPYMHNGAYVTLHGAVLHHLDVNAALANYDLLQLEESLQHSPKMDKRTMRMLTKNLADEVATPRQLTDEEIDQLIIFLHALTSPSATNLAHLVPNHVPSGLPVKD